MNTSKKSWRQHWLVTAMTAGAVLFSATHAAAQCSQSEIAALQSLQQSAFAAGLSLDLNRIAAVTRESQSLYDRLSPGCRAAVDAMQGSGGYGASQPAYGRPPSIYYSPGTDTYIAPNVGACGPSGCMAFD